MKNVVRMGRFMLAFAALTVAVALTGFGPEAGRLPSASAQDSLDCQPGANPKVVTVTARIDVPNVKLKGDRMPKKPARSDTFCVKTGDTLQWVLADRNGNPNPDLGGAKARVVFKKFPNAEERPMLKEGKALDEGPDRTIRGTVDADAFEGRYDYDFFLVRPGSPPQRLKCLWDDPPFDNPDMGGGVRSGGRH